MSELTDKLHERLSYRFKAWNTMEYERGRRDESEYLEPLHEFLLEAVTILELNQCDDNSCDFLKRLRDEVKKYREY